MYLGSMSQPRSWDSFMVLSCEARCFLARNDFRAAILATLQALTDFLAKEAEMQGLTCSWDQEALQEPLACVGQSRLLVQ